MTLPSALECSIKMIDVTKSADPNTINMDIRRSRASVFKKLITITAGGELHPALRMCATHFMKVVITQVNTCE